MAETSPYGTWVSPITAEALAASGHPVSGGRYVGDDIWWLEQRPTEQGRYAIRRRISSSGEVATVLPAPWSARSKVHEYGGGSWAVWLRAAEPEVVFVEASDQRIYRYVLGDSVPIPLTPADAGFVFGELSLQSGHLFAVREQHGDEGAVRRDIVTVPLEGAAADNAQLITSVVAGSDFLVSPRLSPDGSALAWIAWNHPDMPWTSTELKVGTLHDGVVVDQRTLAGTGGESLLQPEWADETSLYVLSDRSGWWNLYRVSASMETSGGQTAPDFRRVMAAERDYAGPLWNVGMQWYRVLADGNIVAVSTFGTDRLELIDPVTGVGRVLDQPVSAQLTITDTREGALLITGGSPALVSGLREMVPVSGRLTDIRLDTDEVLDPRYIPESQARVFSGNGREVHAFSYPPRNPDFAAPEGEKPPYIALVHGGPTAHVSGGLSMRIAYFTSRGIGVVDINYGGSSGYGRKYRERLNGQWGIVDVQDTVTAVHSLAGSGEADGSRLAIRGSSAGGWTVLSALTSTEVFAAGASYYGVADLASLVEATHDFESRYIDLLVGPSSDVELYRKRAPLHNVDGLSSPVLLLQGLDDPVVPPAQSQAFRDALERKGIPHAYLEFSGESHGFRKAETLIAAVEAELSFYGQVFGFEPSGVPQLALWQPDSP